VAWVIGAPGCDWVGWVIAIVGCMIGIGGIVVGMRAT
jgi:hypothetical protein